MPQLRIPGFGANLPDGPSTVKSLTVNETLTVLGAVSFNAPAIFTAANCAANLDIPAGYNAASAGPITIDEDVTVTVGDHSTWSII
jgi:hypothetical protein